MPYSTYSPILAELYGGRLTTEYTNLVVEGFRRQAKILETVQNIYDRKPEMSVTINNGFSDIKDDYRELVGSMKEIIYHRTTILNVFRESRVVNALSASEFREGTTSFSVYGFLAEPGIWTSGSYNRGHLWWQIDLRPEKATSK
jgi:hypothetical protein